MSSEAHSIGISTSLVVEDVPIIFQTSYDDTTLSISVESCALDLAEVAKNRFNDLNVVLPEGGSPLKIAKFSGSISKTDAAKNLSPTGEYRLIKFGGEMQNISIPIPIIEDISIDKAYFYYQYLSAKATPSNPSFKEQVVFLGCRLSVKPGTDLNTALTGAKLTAAYFMSNNATIIYFDFSGTINVGNIIKALFGVTTSQLTIDVKSAGFFRMAKKNTTSTPQPNNNPPIVDSGISYLDALKQIGSLQGKTTAPASGSSAGELMPTSFPLGEKDIMVGTTPTPTVGIKVGADIDTDFTTQFSEAFSGDDVTGICFWVIIDFTKITLFNSLITVGYANDAVNSLVLYGFRTKKTGAQNTPITSAYFYAQLPTITLFNFLTFGGLDGRQGILFKYTTNNNQYELNGSISFTAFSKPFLFGGDLIVNDDKLLAVLDLTVGSPTSSIEKPLGMTGINFAELYLCIDKTFYKAAKAPQPEVPAKLDIAIGGFIDFTFSTGTKIQLSGNVVFEDSKPRLVLVALDASPMLTLNDFVKEVIKEPWQWVDNVTKQIGFISGTMYYLSTEGIADPDNYTFTYDNPLKIINKSGAIPTTTSKTNALTVFKPGYHLETELVLFEKYVFDIKVDVITGNANAAKNGVAISGSYGGTYDKGTGVVTPVTVIKIFFISLESPVLSIGTVGGANFAIEVDNLKLFTTPIGSFTAQYGNGIFTGTYNHQSPKFGFEWQWTKGSESGGFSITKINGLDSQELDAIAKMVSKLNSMTGKGGCGAIVSSMFGELKSSFTPALQSGKSPKDNGNGTMNTPLEIDYKFTISGYTITSGSIKMTLDVDVPTSISGLPGAIMGTLVKNMGAIVEQLLESPTFYEAIALEMAKKGAAKLAGRMLCKAVEEVAETLAEALAEALAAGEIAADLGALLELGAVLTGVLAAGIAGAVGGLLGILKKVWDAIKKIFGGDDGKKKAQDKLDSIKQPVQNLINSLNASLDKVASTIQIHSLKASVDAQGNYKLNWNFPNNADLGENGNLNYKLTFLDGPIGNTTAPQSNIPPIGFTLMKKSAYTNPWSQMQQQDANFQMNASIQTSITGYQFMTTEAEKDLNSTIKTLDEIGDSLNGAVAFNNQIKAFVAKMQGYNQNGLTSNVVYATLDGSSQFVIGQGIIGINTVIK